MILLLDIGNTNTHVGLANGTRVLKQFNIPSQSWAGGEGQKEMARRLAGKRIESAALCSVVPALTPIVLEAAAKYASQPILELNSQTIRGVGIDYPNPRSIGADRLANAVAVAHHFGAPAVVVGFGTAVAFDVVDSRRNYIGGIIAPGLAAMTEYLHEKTALLPRITIREIKHAVGKSTEQAMLIGAVHGYRGLIRGILQEVKKDMNCRRLPVVATGGYAKLIAAGMPEIKAVEPLLTLEGLRLVWAARQDNPDKGG